jgi:hypothetical protein
MLTLGLPKMRATFNPVRPTNLTSCSSAPAQTAGPLLANVPFNLDFGLQWTLRRGCDLWFPSIGWTGLPMAISRGSG